MQSGLSVQGEEEMGPYLTPSPLQSPPTVPPQRHGEPWEDEQENWYPASAQQMSDTVCKINLKAFSGPPILPQSLPLPAVSHASAYHLRVLSPQLLLPDCHLFEFLPLGLENS